MRYLFITKSYPPTPDVSGRIVYDLAEALRTRGNCVDIITKGHKPAKEDQSQGCVYSIENSCWDRLCEKNNNGKFNKFEHGLFLLISFLRKLYLATQIYQFPDVEHSFTKKIVDIYKENITNGIKYDCVIGFFRPYSCLNATSIIKMETPDIFSITYLLDLIEDKDCPKLMPQKLYNKLILKGDDRIGKINDRIVLPTSVINENYSIFDKYSDKVTYCEFPSFTIAHQLVVNKTNGNDCKISFAFAGTMNSDFRNPLPMLNIISELALYDKNRNIVLDIFGGGDCTEIITSFVSPENMRVIYHGKVSKEEVEKAEENADFLINITNKYSSIVPSKIFGLFATCKPIINIKTNEDGSGKYFAKYALQYSVECLNDKANHEQIKNLAEFIYKSAGKLLSFDDVRESFIECTPDYVAETITKMVDYSNGRNK